MRHQRMFGLCAKSTKSSESKCSPSKKTSNFKNYFNLKIRLNTQYNYKIQNKRLAKVKADVRKRRSERERIEKSKEIELDRRKLKLEEVFTSFHIASSGRIEIAIVCIENSFRSL